MVAEHQGGEEGAARFEYFAHVEVGDEHPGDGETCGGQAHGPGANAAGDERNDSREPMHQERLGRDFDAGAQREDDAAAVHDIEDRDGLTRLALGVKRLATEINDEEQDAESRELWGLRSAATKATRGDGRPGLRGDRTGNSQVQWD